uniref:Uncharacterized protein n=1 Tax=Helianthus annuus TaxID=4232 RepID=A0A251UM82_HELAN
MESSSAPPHCQRRPLNHMATISLHYRPFAPPLRHRNTRSHHRPLEQVGYLGDQEEGLLSADSENQLMIRVWLRHRRRVEDISKVWLKEELARWGNFRGEESYMLM